MRFLVILTLVLLTLVLAIAAKRRSKDEWKSRSIFQVLTDRFARSDGSTSACSDLSGYCGGTYKGLKDNLDYIQELGFDAIWISPIIENTPGGYHGYWASDLYELNEAFGTKEDLKELIEEMHKRDIWMMVDVVANHVGPVGTDYSSIKQFGQDGDYHEYCDIDGGDFTTNQWKVENCRLAGLPDLNSESPYVQKTLNDWIDWLVTEYDVDGLRIDTIPEVPKFFWDGFQDAAGCYAIGEVFDGRIDYVSDYTYHVDAVLNYPLSIAMKAVWARDYQSFYDLNDVMDQQGAYSDPDALGVFTDNHDNERFLHIKGDKKALQSSLVFSLFA